MFILSRRISKPVAPVPSGMGVVVVRLAFDRRR